MNLYCIDGSNLAFRAHCAFPSLSIADGFPVGATYGVCRILQKFVEEFQPGKVIMPFDIAKSKYRLGLYPEYKAKRREDKKSQELYETYYPQINVFIELVGKLGITTLAEETRGVEADDVIAYLVSEYRRGRFPKISRVLIVSSDKDLAGLVGPDKVIWFDPISHDLITAENFEERFGVKIEQYTDFKALKGDVSDNVPHPPGVGGGWASKLLKEYGSLDNLLQINHSKVKPYEEVALLARKLVELKLHEVEKDNPVWKRIDDKIFKSTELSSELKGNFADLSFNSILEEWDKVAPKWNDFASCSL